ncbi:glycosyltransferase involved in cell wall biosynthesis [Scopulibacillus darangshiensis]|uniref:Glycosyltransferase involved in cell wall biosynthesis n=1 Tax=Scopulibacillus darangshiensis TaxID=442528 RepID=A0A4R2P5E4_9BACL|nr:glycosyltransferase [Scopulibacillus darangshiensis]TCP30002.1 glycosyltransferase involved in cell wall biosynthesis [Scopulibacillus darangshiensis]
MRKLKILLYGEIDLNIMDGSTIWLSSMAHVLNKDENIEVNVLLKARIRNKDFTEELAALSQINIIDPYKATHSQTFQNPYRMNCGEAARVIEELDEEHHYHCIIIRGFDIAEEMAKTVLISKTIPYITNFTHDKGKINENERNKLKEIYNLSSNMFVQTQEMKDLLKSILGVKGDKFAILSPMIPDYEEQPDFRNHHNTLVYTGKFAKDWYTEEILSAFTRLQGKDLAATLNIVGNKFQGALADQKEELADRMRNMVGLEWFGAVSRNESLRIISKSDIGISWRSSRIDHHDSVELSTKLLEYGRQGTPVLLRRTKMHEDLLGQDYPLFVDSEDDVVRKTSDILNNRKLYRKTAKRVYEACRTFTYTAACERLKPLLWQYYGDRIKLLFAGHDFKFIQKGVEYFRNHPNFEVKVDQWTGHNEHDEIASKSCLDWADIIFCEWGLGNAVWYSNHKKPGQKLIVRMHAQERKTVYPKQFTMDHIDKVIAVSPYIFEEFHRVCQVPRDKMVMIYNMVDTEEFDHPKLAEHEIEFNLGICGILPSLKRFDRALNIFEKLWEKEKRYKLFVKSKLPHELDWLMKRDTEKAYYDNLFERIKSAPWRKNVIFDQHGNDVDEWLRKIGYVLSTSDFESFHLAPMEGMASGSTPVVSHWRGAETIYPKEFIFENEDDMVDFISNKSHDNSSIKDYPKQYFDTALVLGKLEKLMTNVL